MANPEDLIEETAMVASIQGEWMTVEKLEEGASCAGCMQAGPSAFLKRLRRDSAQPAGKSLSSMPPVLAMPGG